MKNSINYHGSENRGSANIYADMSYTFSSVLLTVAFCKQTQAYSLLQREEQKFAVCCVV